MAFSRNCWFVLAVMIFSARAGAIDPPPLSAFATLPHVEKVRVAPNGKMLAWIGYDGEARAVSVYDLARQKYLPPIHTDQKHRLRDLAWADDSTLLITISFVVTLKPESVMPSWEEFSRVLIFDLDTRKASVLLLDENREAFATSVELLRVHTGRPGVLTVASSRLYPSAQCPRTGSIPPECWGRAVFDVNIGTHEETVSASGSPAVVQWIVNPAGQPVARVEWQRRVHRKEIRVLKNGFWARLYRDEDYFQIHPVALSADGTALLAIGPRGRDHAFVWRIPLDGSPIEPVFETDVDVEALIEDPYTGLVVGYQLGGAEQRTHWIDSRYQQLQSALERAFPDRRVFIESYTADLQIVVASVQHGAAPADFYVIDRVRGTADLVGESFPSLVGSTLGHRQLVQFSARDGKPIPAYMTFPAGPRAGDLPLIVLLHDGIGGRDTIDFHWIAQYLATRGYLVMQPQFRGSTGFGSVLLDGGKDQWSGSVLHDVVDGVAHLIADQTVSRLRVCLVGEGLGGYVALAIAARFPETAACIATINGASDLRELYRYYIDNYFNDSINIAEFWERIGSPFSRALDSASPLNLAGKITAPVLLVHSRNDAVVPRLQSESMAAALERRGKTLLRVELPVDDHQLTSRAAREELLRNLDEFLRRYLKPHSQ